MTRISSAILAATLLVAGGCATAGGYSPTVDPHGDPRAGSIEADEAECRRLALDASGGTTEKTVKGAVVGGLLGAAAGAAIGAATGSPATGAAIGAAAGGIGGGAHEGIAAEQDFKSAFRSCMRNRGHHVIG